MPIHLAITRRVRAGCEAEFQQALLDFFRSSFAHQGVLGANMIVPPPDAATREYGILRTFADDAERHAFYASALFKEWDQRVRPLTEGEPVHRPLHGLEAWFRTGDRPPPRWKMAVVTFAGVYVLTLALTLLTAPLIGGWPLPLRNAAFNVLVVAGLTWGVMPLLTRRLQPWLAAPPSNPKTAR